MTAKKKKGNVSHGLRGAEWSSSDVFSENVTDGMKVADILRNASKEEKVTDGKRVEWGRGDREDSMQIPGSLKVFFSLYRLHIEEGDGSNPSYFNYQFALTYPCLDLKWKKELKFRGNLFCLRHELSWKHDVFWRFYCYLCLARRPGDVEWVFTLVRVRVCGSSAYPA